VKHTRFNIKSILQLSILSLMAMTMLLLLGACAGAPKKEKLDLSITATADVNPDMQGRPSPVILHILELNSVEQFNGLGYVALTQPSGAALGAALLGSKQEILQPGASRPLTLELNPQTTAIGLVAGYRDIDNATWRTSIPVVQGESKLLSITLNQQQIITSITD
jgi:type VI secretion system protein VasD